MRHSYHPPTNLSEKEINSTGRLSIRCPHCRQIWATLQKEFEEDYPDFQCSNCYGKFWIPVSLNEISDHRLGTNKAIDYSSPVLGYPHTTPKPISQSIPSSTPLYDPAIKLSIKICPKCSQEVPLTESTCPFCGVAFIKLIEGVTSSIRLKGLWGELLQNWHNEIMHNRFIHACQKENDLIYGVSCYGRILKEDSNNLKAREMIQKIETLSWFFEESPPRWSLDYSMWLYRIRNIGVKHATNALTGIVLLSLLTWLFLV